MRVSSVILLGVYYVEIIKLKYMKTIKFLLGFALTSIVLSLMVIACYYQIKVFILFIPNYVYDKYILFCVMFVYVPFIGFIAGMLAIKFESWYKKTIKRLTYDKDKETTNN